jgi:hypothetical protein
LHVGRRRLAGQPADGVVAHLRDGRGEKVSGEKRGRKGVRTLFGPKKGPDTFSRPSWRRLCPLYPRLRPPLLCFLPWKLLHRKDGSVIGGVAKRNRKGRILHHQLL